MDNAKCGSRKMVSVNSFESCLAACEKEQNHDGWHGAEMTTGEPGFRDREWVEWKPAD